MSVRTMDLEIASQKPGPSKLMPFQNDLCGLLLYPSDRLFYVCDKIGGTGKSVWAQVVRKHAKCLILRGGTAVELRNTIVEKFSTGLYRNVVLDLTTGRPSPADISASLRVCELLHEGFILTKGHGCNTVIVLSSEESPLKELSIRRWLVTAPKDVEGCVRLVACSANYDEEKSLLSVKITDNIFPPPRATARVTKTERKAIQDCKVLQEQREKLDGYMRGDVTLSKESKVALKPSKIAEVLGLPYKEDPDSDKENK